MNFIIEEESVFQWFNLCYLDEYKRSKFCDKYDLEPASLTFTVKMYWNMKPALHFGGWIFMQLKRF